MRIDAKRYSLGAAALAAIVVVVELVRVFVAPHRIPGLVVATTDVLALVAIGLLAIAAIGLALHRRFGFVAGVLGALGAMGYGAAAEAGRATWGAVYLVVGVAILYALGKSLPYMRSVAT